MEPKKGLINKIVLPNTDLSIRAMEQVTAVYNKCNGSELLIPERSLWPDCVNGESNECVYERCNTS